jgi:arylsulfatase A-like enzyme
MKTWSPVASVVAGTWLALAGTCAAQERPNLLVAIADDWSWPHASAYGAPVVKTPAFDRLAREGVLFQNAFVASPSCTPSRAALLTGQWHWRLEESANLWSTLRYDYPTYSELLARAGYHVGLTGKGWGPGRDAPGGRAQNPAGKSYGSLEAFLDARPAGEPFAYWFGSSDPHRDYETGAGVRSGIDAAGLQLFPHLPDVRQVREDVADYVFEVQRFDRDVGRLLQVLEQRGELERTVVVVTSDNGMPFPRCKANLYECGVHVPLVVRWPARGARGARVESFVSLVDLAPTFLDLAGIPAPAATTGRSLVPLLEGSATGDRAGAAAADRARPAVANRAGARDFVIAGKERHVPGQEAPDLGGTPMRMIRTRDYLYIRNFRPDRWPAGTPDADKAVIPGRWLADCDNGPTKSHMADARDRDEASRRLWNLAFGKRPAEELYDLRTDPWQLVNVASRPEYADTVRSLSDRLIAELRASNDPRVVGGADRLEVYPYYGESPMKPGFVTKPQQ